MSSTVNEFLENRNPEEYTEMLNEMMISFVPTDDFAEKPSEQRKNMMLCYKELIELINKLVAIKKKRDEEQAEA
jgi:hypothetical protein